MKHWRPPEWLHQCSCGLFVEVTGEGFIELHAGALELCADSGLWLAPADRPPGAPPEAMGEVVGPRGQGGAGGSRPELVESAEQAGEQPRAG